MEIPLPREQIAEVARGWIGTPYHHQASCKGVGADCLGLLRGTFRELFGHEPELPPPYSADWAESQGRETLLDAARRHLIEIEPADASTGDILAFRWREDLPAKHVVIMTAPDRFIHASERTSIHEVSLTPWWRRRIAAAFAFPPRPLA